MRYGARNNIRSRVSSVKKSDVKSLIQINVTTPVHMTSVLTTKSVEHLNFEPGEEIQLIIKAIHVLPVKE